MSRCICGHAITAHSEERCTHCDCARAATKPRTRAVRTAGASGDAVLLTALAERLRGSPTAGANFAGQLHVDDLVVEISVRVRRAAPVAGYMIAALQLLALQPYLVAHNCRETTSRRTYGGSRHSCRNAITSAVVHPRGTGAEGFFFRFVCKAHARAREALGGADFLAVIDLPRARLVEFRRQHEHAVEERRARVCTRCGHRSGAHHMTGCEGHCACEESKFTTVERSLAARAAGGDSLAVAALDELKRLPPRGHA